MALSPNYGWAEPDNSSLVKNGAQDIRALGDAIDTSVWNVGYGQAAKNKILNGDFAINQRAFTSITTTGIYAFDRWQTQVAGDGTVTFTPQTFTANELTITGYGQPTNYFRCVTTGQTTTASRASFQQNIENVTTLAGTTVTFSFYAKAATGTPSVALELRQNFGSGGSATVEYPLGKIQISTSWARYSLTTTLNNLSGKTVGTTSLLTAGFFFFFGSDLAKKPILTGIQSNKFAFWGFQV